jgi:hypothetical protein
MVNIKVVHKDNARRFNLPPNASWIDLEAKLRTIFNIPKLTPFTLSYTDEDNDVITLSTDIELREIFASNPTIKFNLKFSTSDDLSDSENEDVWVFEGSAAPGTTIETDNSVLQSNVSQKNIISTTNQEPQHIEDDNVSDDDDNENEKPNKKIQVDDDFERVENLLTDPKRVEKSPSDVERIEKSQNDAEREKELPSDVESEKESQNDVEREKESQNDAEREKESQNDDNIVEESPKDADRVKESASDIDRVETLPSGVESVEKSPKDVDRAERLSNDLFVGISSNNISVKRSDKVELSNFIDRVENSSTKKISRVNLLDDEFFESFSSLSFEPKSLLQREVEDEQEDKETTETLSLSNPSAFSPFLELGRPKRRQDQNTVEQLKDMIEQYEDTIKENPILAASIMDQIRSSVDPERLDPFPRPTQSKEDKHNSYFRQHPITSPVSGRSRSATPPRFDYNRSSTPEHTRSSTPPRFDYNRSPMPEHTRSSTPPRRSITPEYTIPKSGYSRLSPSPSRSGYNRTSTPEYTRSSTTPRSRYNRHSPSPSRSHNRTPTPEFDNINPPQLPGSFPSSELWINEPETNSNQKNGRGRRGRGRGRRGRPQVRNNRSPANTKQITNEGKETPNMEETQIREETPELQGNEAYNNDVQTLIDIFALTRRQAVKLLEEHDRNVELAIDSRVE